SQPERCYKAPSPARSRCRAQASLSQLLPRARLNPSPLQDHVSSHSPKKQKPPTDRPTQSRTFCASPKCTFRFSISRGLYHYENLNDSFFAPAAHWRRFGRHLLADIQDRCQQTRRRDNRAAFEVSARHVVRHTEYQNQSSAFKTLPANLQRTDRRGGMFR